MGSRERAVMGLESGTVSAQVTQNCVTILVKHVISNVFCILNRFIA